MNIEAELILYYSNPIMSDFCLNIPRKQEPKKHLKPFHYRLNPLLVS